MNIVQFPDPILTSPAKEMSLPQGLETGTALLQACLEADWGNCVGMAAPQINRPERVLVALGRVFINPRIVWHSKVSSSSYEGCYSLGYGNEYKIKRFSSIKLVWINEDGIKEGARFYGHEAIILQHEYDHLEGLLINRGRCIRPGTGLAEVASGKSTGHNSGGDGGSE